MTQLHAAKVLHTLLLAHIFPHSIFPAALLRRCAFVLECVDGTSRSGFTLAPPSPPWLARSLAPPISPLLLPAPPVTSVHFHGDKLHLQGPSSSHDLGVAKTFIGKNILPHSLCFQSFFETCTSCACCLIAVKIGCALLTLVVPPRVVGIIWNANKGRCQAIIIIMDQSVDSFFQFGSSLFC